MRRGDGDLIGGAALAVTGLGAAAWAGSRLEFGSLSRMGPGFFPVVLGLALAGLGGLTALPTLTGPRAPGPAADLHWREAACVIGAIALFAFGLQRIGLLPVTAAAVLLASAPAPHPGLGWRLALAVVLTALTWLVFVAGLQMSLPLGPWD